APQPLPGRDRRRDLVTISAADTGFVVGNAQAQLRLVFDPAAVARLALLPALPRRADPAIVRPFHVGVLVQHPITVFIAPRSGRQMHVEESALVVLVDARPGFYPYRLPKDHVLPVQSFDPH